MTVCVAIKVHDCIVFAADSAVTTMTSVPNGASMVHNVWQNGLKVYSLHRHLPIMAMTSGLGNFGSMSINSLAKDFRIMLTKVLAKEHKYTIEVIAQIARTYFQKEYAKINPPPSNPSSFEFWIGGYGSETKHGEVWKIEIRDGQSFAPIQLASSSVSHRILWGGQIQAISRLLLGLDPELSLILNTLNLHEDHRQQISLALSGIESPLVHPSMPVQDAIDLADFLVDLTKRYVAFLPCANTVGGDTDIATVTRHEGFKWIRRKHYYSLHLNRREIDHAT